MANLSQDFQDHLHSAGGDPEPLRNWIELQVNAKDENGLTALHKCCKAGQLEKVKYVIQIGAQIDVQQDTPCRTFEKDRTPLLFAATYGHLEIVQYLT